MAVGVTGSDSLKFVAELDNDGFLKKSKEIETSIQKSAIAGEASSRKQGEAIKEQVRAIKTANEAAIETAGQLEKSNITSLKGIENKTSATKKLTAAISDSRKEAEAYNESLKGTLSGTSTVHEKPNFAIQSNEIRSREMAAAKALENTYTNNNLGLLEKQREKLEELKVAQDKSTNINRLAIYNAKIEKLTADIKKLENAGKTGFDDMGNKISRSLDRPIGQLNRLTAAAKLYQNAAATSTNPEIISKYNRKLQETQVQIGQLSNVGKKGFDELGNAIKGSGNFIGKAFSALRQIAYVLPGVGIAGILAFATEPIIDYIVKLDIFGAKITQAARNLQALNDVNKNGSGNASSEITTLKILYNAATDVTLSTQERIKATKELQLLYPQSFEASKTQAILNGDEKDSFDKLTLSILAVSRAKAVKDKLDEIEAKRLDVAIQKGKIQLANQNEKAKGEKEIRKRLGKADTNGNMTFLRSNKQADKAIEEQVIKPSDKRAKEALKLKDAEDKQLKNTANFLIKYAGQENLVDAVITKKGKVKPTPIIKDDPSIKAAQSLKDEVIAINEEFAVKVKKQDDAEIEAVNSKFLKLSNKIKKFNEDPKNKVKVDGSSLDKTREAAIADLQSKKQQAEQEKLLAEFMTYAEKRQKVVKEYQDKETALRKAGYTEKADLAKAEGIRQANQIDDQNIKTLGQLEKLLTDIENMGVKEARNAIGLAQLKIKEQLKAGTISIELAEEQKKKLEQASELIKQRLPDGLITVANAMDRIVSLVGDMDSGFANVLKMAAGVTGELGNAFRAAADFQKFKKANDIGGQLGAGVNMLTAGLAIVQTVNTFLDRQTQADKERQNSKDQELRSTEALTKALERQLAVADKAYGTKKIDEYRKAILDAQKAIEDGTKSLSGRNALTGDSDLDKLITKVNNGEKLSSWSWWGMTDKEFYDAAKSNLHGVTTDVKKLQELLDKGMLDEATAKIAQNFINAVDAIDKAKEAMAEFNTATSFTEIADSIVDLFARGNAAAADFGDNFENIMKKAILNSFKTQSLAKQLQDFYSHFADFSASDGQLSSGEIERLRTEYNNIIADSQQKFADLEKATGISFAPKPEDAAKAGNNTLSGAIKGITETQADLLAGQFGGLRLTALQQLQIATQSFDKLAQIETNTYRLHDMVPILKAIQVAAEKGSGVAAANGRKGG